MTLNEHLARHRQWFNSTSLLELFDSDPQRATRFTFETCGLRADLSKNHVTDETLQLLAKWAEEKRLPAAIERLFAGEIVNPSENRPAWHPRLRNLSLDETRRTLAQMENFISAIRAGQWLGGSGQRITDIVTIGIGGSDLGPRLVVDALAPYRLPGLDLHFVANLDSVECEGVLRDLNPESTLIIVSSKSFSTRETMANAERAARWLSANGISELKQHFVAVTANPAKAADANIPFGEIFNFHEGVGGRFSLWSSIGLPIALALGIDAFRELLSGAASMDVHFRQAPLQTNLPVLLALIGAWYTNFWDTRSRAVIPYVHGLRYLPDYLRQLEMESNGKSITVDNRPVEHQTCGVVWGSSGTMGQHSFFQLLHQGTSLIPVEFISVLGGVARDCEGYLEMIANCLSQSRILMRGKNLAEVKAEMREQGFSADEIKSLAPQKVMPGNRPSTTIILDELSPRHLGALLALCEHRVYVLSILWEINAFDQWGVEYGKKLSAKVFDILEGRSQLQELDSSTLNLIRLYQQQT